MIFWWIHDLCNALHTFIPCSCVSPRIIKSPATGILQGLRLHCHAFMILYAWYVYCCYASSDFDDTCMWIASVLASLHIITAWVLFLLPGSAHNFGGVPNRSCDDWQWLHGDKEQFISLYTQNFHSSLRASQDFTCVSQSTAWISRSWILKRVVDEWSYTQGGQPPPVWYG